MFPKKDLVAEVEVDDPQWEATSFKKCLVGTQQWRDYLKMPESVKVSFRFVDPEPPIQTSILPGFNLNDFLKKYRRKYDEFSSTLHKSPHITELTQRLSDLESRIQELSEEKSIPDVFQYKRSSRPSRPNLSCYCCSQPSNVYSLAGAGRNTNNKFNNGTQIVRKARIQQPDSLPDDPWVFTNKRTQYSAQKISTYRTHPKCIDKSTSFLVSRSINRDAAPKLCNCDDSIKCVKDPCYCETQTNQISTLFRRISRFLNPIKRTSNKRCGIEIEPKDNSLRMRGSGHSRSFCNAYQQYSKENQVIVERNVVSRTPSEEKCECCVRGVELRPSVLTQVTTVTRHVPISRPSNKKPVKKRSRSRSVSCTDLVDMSKTLERQTADIEDLKRMVGQCLERLEEKSGICSMSKKERNQVIKQCKKAEKLRKKEEKQRRKDEKRRRKEQKRFRKAQERERKAREREQKHARRRIWRRGSERTLPAYVTRDCRCCKCGETGGMCRCGEEVALPQVPSLAPKGSTAALPKRTNCPCVNVNDCRRSRTDLARRRG